MEASSVEHQKHTELHSGEEQLPSTEPSTQKQEKDDPRPIDYQDDHVETPAGNTPMESSIEHNVNSLAEKQHKVEHYPVDHHNINHAIAQHQISTEQHLLDLHTEGQPEPHLVETPLVSMQPQIDLPFVKHQAHSTAVHDPMELSSQQQRANPTIEQGVVDRIAQKLIPEQQHFDSPVEKSSNVHLSTSHNTRPMAHHLPSDSPGNQPFIVPPTEVHDIELSTEQKTVASSEVNFIQTTEGPPVVEAGLANYATETSSGQMTVTKVEDYTKEEAKELSEPSVSTAACDYCTEGTASRESSSTLPLSQKLKRAEIDTTAPFESVKAAVSLFGERMDWKSQVRAPQTQGSKSERRVLSESELQKVQEDLLYDKEQLALTQASTAGVLLELRKIKKLIQRPASTQDATNDWWYTSADTTDPSKTIGDNNVELHAVIKEVESVKEELVLVRASRESAMKGLQDAIMGRDTVLKRVDELAGEQASLNEALSAAHIALADAEEQVAQLRSGQKIDMVDSLNDSMEKKSVEIKGLESKLAEANAMVKKLKEELAASKKAESLAVVVAAEAREKVGKVKLELEQAKSEELSMVGKLAKILEESDEVKAKLEKAMEERATLSSTVLMLRSSLEQGRMELDSMHEQEQVACATLASLQDELHEVKEALKSAQVGEARALEAKDTLPAAIKQAASEADEAKAAAEAWKEEARKARQGMEQAKAATSTAMSRQQAALKEREAAKTSEAMALAELKALTGSETQGANMESESEGVTISLEEYSALKQAAVEAESLADNKVAEVVAQVEDAKANQLKAESKLDDAVKEAKISRDELHKAQKQADDAQEAKLIAEGELRKWRAEHDQRRKSGGAPSDLKGGATQSSQRKLINEEEIVKPSSQDVLPPLVPGKRVAGRDTLAQVMSLTVPASERLDRVLPVEDLKKEKEKIKKKNIIRRIASVVVLKKKTV